METVMVNIELIGNGLEGQRRLLRGMALSGKVALPADAVEWAIKRGWVTVASNGILRPGGHYNNNGWSSIRQVRAIRVLAKMRLPDNVSADWRDDKAIVRLYTDGKWWKGENFATTSEIVAWLQRLRATERAEKAAKKAAQERIAARKGRFRRGLRRIFRFFIPLREDQA